MPIQVLINVSIAFLWMFLQEEWSVLAFFGGYIVGILVLFIMRRFLNGPFYLNKIVAVFQLFLVFLHELITSSILVTRQVLSPKINITPGIFTLETELEGELEVTLLAMLLTLTPGSVVIEVSPNGRVFYIHAMDIPESSDAVFRSQKVFENAIKKVTRT